MLLLWILSVIRVSYHTALSVTCSFVVTFCVRADLLVLLYVIFSCVFVTLPYGVLDQMWYLIVRIPDFCLIAYFEYLLFAIDSFHIVISLSNRFSYEKSIKLFLKMKWQIAY